ncbi:stomatin 2 [Sulfuricaulis limicola]|uniref:Stomatin 2 n=1 Tax=Sulfuricaulis limicola TaxID=1620215 RepID=A0A1B4XFB8_9GAMM|nr:stomatin-like protein [Sulfuricaulis limicola]BAV33486.1 stomatin 2 [Sulfuricaulis limicola]
MLPFGIILIVAIIFIFLGVKIVPQQSAYVVERLGRYHAVLNPGLNLIIPFVDRLAYRHSLKEVAMDIAPQICITRDNTQINVDGVLYYQVTDAKMASYGAENYVAAISQLAQTTLRSEIGKLELDKTFEEREHLNRAVIGVLDTAAVTWGVKVLRYEIKDITPPAAILHAMQAQITAEREKRALIAKSEGERQEQINIADGERQAAIKRSEGERQAMINRAEGEAKAILAVAEANAKGIKAVGESLIGSGGDAAANLKVAERYIEAFEELAKAGNTLIVPSTLSDISGTIASVMSVIRSAESKPVAPRPAKA